MFDLMTTEPPKKRGRPARPADQPKAEKTTLTLEPGMRERIRKALAAQAMMDEDGDEDMSALVHRLLEAECTRIEARFTAKFGRKK